MEREKNNQNSEEAASELDPELGIEGGEIAKSDMEGGDIPGEFHDYGKDSIRMHKATTTRWLAYLLIIILGGSFVIHYGVMAWLAAQNKTDAMEVVERTFNTWLPVISGLAAAAATYFFTRERDGRR